MMAGLVPAPQLSAAVQALRGIRCFVIFFLYSCHCRKPSRNEPAKARKDSMSNNLGALPRLINRITNKHKRRAGSTQEVSSGCRIYEVRPRFWLFFSHTLI